MQIYRVLWGNPYWRRFLEVGPIIAWRKAGLQWPIPLPLLVIVAHSVSHTATKSDMMKQKKGSFCFSWSITSPLNWGTGIRGLMRRMATLPQGNQELLVVRDKVGRPPDELEVSKSRECDIFPSVLWHCWLGDRKGIRPVKNRMLVCWWWWFDWSFAWLTAPIVQLSPPPPSSFASINTG